MCRNGNALSYITRCCSVCGQVFMNMQRLAQAFVDGESLSSWLPIYNVSAHEDVGHRVPSDYPKSCTQLMPEHFDTTTAFCHGLHVCDTLRVLPALWPNNA